MSKKRRNNSLLKPRISIICPTRNAGKYIEETIKSILAQTYQNWEFLIMDGASTDGTANIAKTHSRRDKRIQFHSELDEGPWHAADKGLNLARGEFICFLGGQDGFLDKEWLAKCADKLDADRSVSMVWGSSRAMSEEGKLLDDGSISYSHLIREEGSLAILANLFKKTLSTLSDFLFGNAPRREFLFKKIFSRTALLRLNFLTWRSFPRGVAPQKSDWFLYWLNTGIAFTDQGACVSKRVYLECAPRYPSGSRMVNHLTDFNFNFNSRGYLASYIPTFAVFGRMHPGASGERVGGELYSETEKYMKKVLDLKKRILKNHEEVFFRDRNGNPVFSKRF